MYLITENEFIATRPGHGAYDAAKTRFLSGDYDFVVFSEDSPEHSLLTKADPQRTRIIYRQENYICTNGIICVERRPTESYIDFLSKNPDPCVYLSGLGHCNRSQGTLAFALEDVSSIAEKIAMLVPFVSLRRVLFYGSTHSSRKNVIAGMSHHMDVDVVNVKVDASKKSLFEWMIENKCFAVLGMDGAVVPCWRDWEIALAGVPALRHTCRSENLPFVNPCGCYSTFIDVDDGEQAVQQLSEEIKNGSAAKRLLLSSALATTAAQNCEFSEAMDALACDHKFFLKTIREGRGALGIFVRKGKETPISVPSPLNHRECCKTLITTAKASPKSRILTAEEEAILGIWRADHKQWGGYIELKNDGSFKGGGSKPDGTWEVKHEHLTLWWTHWPPDRLHVSSKNKISKTDFELTRVPLVGSVKNVKTGTTPIIIHASGDTKKRKLFGAIQTAPFKVTCPATVTVVTYSNLSCLGYLEKGLENAHVPYVTARLSSDIHPHPFWQKMHSLRTVIDKLKTDFVLSLDNFDVWINGDLGRMVEWMVSQKADALIGAEKDHWPNIDTKAAEDKIGEEYAYKYLNSGVWLAKTCFLNELLETLKEPLNDQEFFKRAYAKMHPRIIIDGNAAFIGNLNYAEADYFIEPPASA